MGNALCLDLANTVNARPVAATDRLASHGWAWAWAVDAGLLPHRLLDRVHDHADELQGLRQLRRAVWAVFDAVVDREPLPERPLAELLSAHAGALARAQWRVDSDRAHLLWPPPSRLGDLVGPAADSAVWLLRTGPLGRVGRCPTCRWLFLDTSRNGGRRWCSMATCGSRLKTARHTAKARSRADSSP